jgi:AAA+ ATPase superfamily predicted ATPase
MRNVVGNPARGENFFRRDKEVRKILKSIENDNNIQIAAPRRVGKTSILFHLLDAGVKGYKYVYVDTESVDSEEIFYKKLLKEIVKLPGIEPLAEKFLKAAGSLARKIKSLKVMEVGIDWQEGPADVSYYEDLVHLLCGIQLDEGMRLVLLIDEFPQTILNIVKRGGVDMAVAFLQSNRTLRLHPEINQKVRFIYTGSIGLNHTVASIDSTAFINDLNTLEIEPLRPAEARSFLDELLKARGVSMKPSAQDHLDPER